MWWWTRKLSSQPKPKRVHSDESLWRKHRTSLGRGSRLERGGRQQWRWRQILCEPEHRHPPSPTGRWRHEASRHRSRTTEVPPGRGCWDEESKRVQSCDEDQAEQSWVHQHHEDQHRTECLLHLKNRKKLQPANFIFSWSYNMLILLYVPWYSKGDSCTFLLGRTPCWGEREKEQR